MADWPPNTQALTAPDAPDSTGARRALRAVAGFEAFKGVLALGAGLGFLGLLHHDLYGLVVALIGHVGLNPGDHYPALVLSDIAQLRQARLLPLLLAVGAYVAVRFTEAWGLWRDRVWGEWLGALSGALYLPFELWHLLHRPSLSTAAVILVNAVLVAFLGWRLWLRRHARGA